MEDLGGGRLLKEAGPLQATPSENFPRRKPHFAYLYHQERRSGAAPGEFSVGAGVFLTDTAGVRQELSQGMPLAAGHPVENVCQG